MDHAIFHEEHSILNCNREFDHIDRPPAGRRQLIGIATGEAIRMLAARISIQLFLAALRQEAPIDGISTKEGAERAGMVHDKDNVFAQRRPVWNQL